MARLRISRFTAAVLVVTALLVVPLLTITDHDSTYSCSAVPVVDVVHPEPEMGAVFRRDVGFDSGHACNQAARSQVVVAGCLAAIATVIIRVRRRQRPAASRGLRSASGR